MSFHFLHACDDGSGQGTHQEVGSTSDSSTTWSSVRLSGTFSRFMSPGHKRRQDLSARCEKHAVHYLQTLHGTAPSTAACLGCGRRV